MLNWLKTQIQKFKTLFSKGKGKSGNSPDKLGRRTYRLGQLEIVYDPSDTLVLKARHGFGDNLMATAVIESIHREYPALRIIVFAKHPEIFANNDRIYACWNINEVPKEHPLLKKAVDLEYRDFAKRIKNKSDESHYIDNLYDCIPIAVSNRCYRPRLFLTEQEQNYRSAELESLPRPLVAIAPYGKSKSPIPSKIYPKSKWDKVIRLLVAAGVNIIQIGDRSEGPLLSGVGDWQDLGYRHTAVVLSHCDAVITHPGGVMHLAVACNVPCVVLFGGIENPVVSGYPQNRNITVPLDCAPCWRKKLCRKPRCLDLLTPEIIAQETIDLMKSATKL